MGDEGAKRLGEMLLAGVGLEPLSSVCGIDTARCRLC